MTSAWCATWDSPTVSTLSGTSTSYTAFQSQHSSLQGILALWCSKCSQIVQSSNGMNKHMTRRMAKVGQEEQPKELSCGTCNYNFASKCVLRKHMKRVHPIKVLCFKSPVCGKKLAKNKCVAQHMSCVHVSSNIPSSLFEMFRESA